MRRRTRAATVTLASLLGSLALGASASSAAAASDLGVAQTAWFWQRLAPGLSPEPSNVPAGDLAVAADASGSATKASYVALDLTGVPARATVRGLSVTLALDPAAQQLMAAPPALMACRAAGVWAAGEGVDWAAKPADDCTAAVAGVYDATAKTYRFDVVGYVPAWRTTANRGFVVLPAPAAAGAVPAPFQLAFVGRPVVAADITTPPADVGGAPSGSGSGGVAAPAGPAPLPEPYVAAPALGDVVTTPVAPAAAPQPPPRPAVAAPARRTVVRARVAVPLSAEDAPSAAFLLALLAGGAAVAGTAVLMAEDSLTPASVIARRRAVRASEA